MITARAVVLAIVRMGIVPAIVRRAIASSIIVGITNTPAIVMDIITTTAIIGTFTDRTKRSLNLVKLIHVSLTGNKALDIRCLLLLGGSVPSRVFAHI